MTFSSDFPDLLAELGQAGAIGHEPVNLRQPAAHIARGNGAHQVQHRLFVHRAEHL